MAIPQNPSARNEQAARPVLSASGHDVKPLAALLRGVNFSNRATVTVTQDGFTVIVEEARTLLGTAFVFSNIFDEYHYQPPPPSPPPSQSSPPPDSQPPNTAFEIPLNTLIECLNIFGTASSSSSAQKATHRTWWRANEEDGGGSDEEGNRDRRRGRSVQPLAGAGRIDQFSPGSNERGTAMRMSYAGSGHPLTVLLAEDAQGPTATCEITTFDPEPHLELPFDADSAILRIILRSSWLREALSEIDPTCDKLTFISNPPTAAADEGQAANRNSTRVRASSRPLFRIEAEGMFGSTEMDYPNDRDVLETFECSEPIQFSYRFAHISRALRVLQSSAKTSLRIDPEGLLSLQFLMPSPKRGGGWSDAFIEFRCLPLDEDLR